MSFVLEIVSFELVALNTHFLTFTEREHLSSGIHNLWDSLKISNTTKTEFFERKLFQSDQKIWQNYCRVHLSSVSEPLTSWLSISVLTKGFLGI